VAAHGSMDQEMHGVGDDQGMKNASRVTFGAAAADPGDGIDLTQKIAQGPDSSSMSESSTSNTSSSSSQHSGPESVASSSDRESSPDCGSSDSSRSEDAVLMVDEEADEVLFYDSGGDVSTVSFAQILNALQTANNESLGGMECICAVI